MVDPLVLVITFENTSFSRKRLGSFQNFLSCQPTHTFRKLLTAVCLGPLGETSFQDRLLQITHEMDSRITGRARI